MQRSSRPDVRNPLLQLPAAAQIRNLAPDARQALEQLLREISADSRQRAAECWRKHKAPMAAYWKANAVYARHMAMLCRYAPAAGQLELEEVAA